MIRLESRSETRSRVHRSFSSSSRPSRTWADEPPSSQAPRFTGRLGVGAFPRTSAVLGIAALALLCLGACGDQPEPAPTVEATVTLAMEETPDPVEAQACYDRVMGSEVSWCQGACFNWESSNAHALCDTSPDADATIGCFESFIAEGFGWSQAIETCSACSTCTGAGQTCLDAVMNGEVSWCEDGCFEWGETFARQLCDGATSSERLLACFDSQIQAGAFWHDAMQICHHEQTCYDRVMGGELSYCQGDCFDWAPANAQTLCEASPDADDTIACFESFIAEGFSWNEGIATCGSCASCTGQGKVCFDAVMSGQVSWCEDGCFNWSETNAHALCDETSSSTGTIACFESYIDGGAPWDEAIAVCDNCPECRYEAPEPTPIFPPEPYVPPGTGAGDDVGNVKVALQVGSAGSLSWSMPLATVDGPAGLNVGLGLAGAAEGSEGLVGVGARLTGLSAIHRCAKNEALEAHNRAFEWLAWDHPYWQDSICVDGERLIRLSGEYGTVDSQYTTLTESGDIYTLKGAPMTDPGAYFVAHRRGGQVERYGGNGSNGVVKVQFPGMPFPTTATWLLTKTTTPGGANAYYDYDYVVENEEIGDDLVQYHDQVRLNRIYFKGVNNTPDDRRIDFDYECGSKRIGYSNGIRQTRRCTLTAVNSSVANLVVSTTKLSYEISPATGRKRLSSVQVCGVDQTGSSCLRPAEFDWSDGGEFGFETDETYQFEDHVLPDTRYTVSSHDGAGGLSLWLFKPEPQHNTVSVEYWRDTHSAPFAPEIIEDHNAEPLTLEVPEPSGLFSLPAMALPAYSPTPGNTDPRTEAVILPLSFPDIEPRVGFGFQIVGRDQDGEVFHHVMRYSDPHSRAVGWYRLVNTGHRGPDIVWCELFESEGGEPLNFDNLATARGYMRVLPWTDVTDLGSTDAYGNDLNAYLLKDGVMTMWNIPNREYHDDGDAIPVGPIDTAVAYSGGRYCSPGDSVMVLNVDGDSAQELLIHHGSASYRDPAGPGALDHYFSLEERKSHNYDVIDFYAPPGTEFPESRIGRRKSNLQFPLLMSLMTQDHDTMLAAQDADGGFSEKVLWFNGTPPFFYADINGDGLTDLLAVEAVPHESWDDDYEDWSDADRDSISRLGAIVNEVLTQGRKPTGTAENPFGIYVYYGTGGGYYGSGDNQSVQFERSHEPIYEFPTDTFEMRYQYFFAFQAMRISDWNNDGKSDFLIPHNLEWTAYLSTAGNGYQVVPTGIFVASNDTTGGVHEHKEIYLQKEGWSGFPVSEGGGAYDVNRDGAADFFGIELRLRPDHADIDSGPALGSKGDYIDGSYIQDVLLGQDNPNFIADNGEQDHLYNYGRYVRAFKFTGGLAPDRLMAVRTENLEQRIEYGPTLADPAASVAPVPLPFPHDGSQVDNSALDTSVCVWPRACRNVSRSVVTRVTRSAGNTVEYADPSDEVTTRYFYGDFVYHARYGTALGVGYRTVVEEGYFADPVWRTDYFDTASYDARPLRAPLHRGLAIHPYAGLLKESVSFVGELNESANLVRYTKNAYGLRKAEGSIFLWPTDHMTVGPMVSFPYPYAVDHRGGESLAFQDAVCAGSFSGVTAHCSEDGQLGCAPKAPCTPQELDQQEPLTHTSWTADYDEYGNVWHGTSTIHADDGQHVRETWANWSYSKASLDEGHFLNRLMELSVVHRDPNGNESITTTEYECFDNAGDTGGVKKITLAPGDAAYETEVTVIGRNNYKMPTMVVTNAQQDGITQDTYTYSADGRHLLSVMNTLGESTSLTYDAIGRPTTITDPRGVQQQNAYDPLGRLTWQGTVDEFDNTLGTDVTIVRKPEDIGYVVEVTRDGSIGFSRSYFDAWGREYRSESPNTQGDVLTGEVDFDAYGRVWRTVAPRAPNYPLLATTYAYDSAGRLAQVSAPSGTTTIEYDGLSVIRTNAEGEKTRTWSNGAGHSLVTTGYNTQYASTVERISELDVEGNTVLRIIRGCGVDNNPNTPDTLCPNDRVYTFNKHGHLIQSSDDRGLTTYTPNRRGQVTMTLDANGTTTTYDYDAMGRPHAVEYDNGLTTTYTWNPQYSAELSSVSSSNGDALSFGYDSFGRPVWTSRLIDGDSYESSTVYDGHNRVLQSYLPDNLVDGVPGIAVQSVYGPYGELQRMHDVASPGTVYYEVLDRDVHDRVTDEGLVNGIITERYFDPVTGRLTHFNSENANAELLQSWTFTRDALGRIVTQEQSGGGLAQLQLDYAYDPLGRLSWIDKYVDDNYTGREEYGYDTLHNMVQSTQNGVHQYNVKGQPKFIGDFTFDDGIPATQVGYDQRGALLGYYHDGTKYLLGRELAFGKVSTITADGVDEELDYDMFGDLLHHRDNIAKRVTTYVGGGLRVVTTDATTEYLYKLSTGQGATQLKFTTVNGVLGDPEPEVSVMLLDRKGNAEVATDDAGEETERMMTDVWGTTRDHTTFELGEYQPNAFDHGVGGQPAPMASGTLQYNNGRNLFAEAMVMDRPDILLTTASHGFITDPVNYSDPSGWAAINECGPWVQTGPNTKHQNCWGGGPASGNSSGGGSSGGGSVSEAKGLLDDLLDAGARLLRGESVPRPLSLPPSSGPGGASYPTYHGGYAPPAKVVQPPPPTPGPGASGNRSKRDNDGRAGRARGSRDGNGDAELSDREEAIDTALEVGGVVNPVADVLLAYRQWKRGDKLAAAFSMVGVIPVFGDGLQVAKLSLKGAKAAKTQEIGVGAAGLVGLCLVAGTPIHTEEDTVPIESLEVGDRVTPGSAGTCGTSQRESDYVVVSATVVTDGEETDTLVTVLLDKASARGLAVGEDLHGFSVHELSAQGALRVNSVRPAAFDSGPGCLVTMTTSRVAPELVHLHLSSGETISTTAPHPYWSADREAWVEAGELEVGERIASLDDGAVTLVDKAFEQAPTRVYNIEVDAEHAYRVGESGIWSHNAGSRVDLPDSMVWKDDGMYTEMGGPPGKLYNIALHTKDGVISGNIHNPPGSGEQGWRIMKRALDHITETGDPKKFKGIWQRPAPGETSKNWEDYHNALSEGAGPFEAAKRTWTARQLQPYGFTTVETVTPSEEAIHVIFSR